MAYFVESIQKWLEIPFFFLLTGGWGGDVVLLLSLFPLMKRREDRVFFSFSSLVGALISLAAGRFWAFFPPLPFFFFFLPYRTTRVPDFPSSLYNAINDGRRIPINLKPPLFFPGTIMLELLGEAIGIRLSRDFSLSFSYSTDR